MACSSEPFVEPCNCVYGGQRNRWRGNNMTYRKIQSVLRILFEALRHRPENGTTDTSSSFSVAASSLTTSITL